MARKKIGEFTKVVPNSGDRILIEQNGAGRSAVLSSLPVSDPTMEALNDVRKEVAKVYKFKGAVTHKTDLPATGIVAGDAYNVSSEGKTYAYNGSSWIAIGVDTVTDEVLQAREGYDGTIYSDLGTAIRTQVSSLNASQDQVAKELKGDIFDLTGIVSNKIDDAEVKDGELVLYADGEEKFRLSGFGGGGGTGGGGAVTSSVLTVRNTSGSLSKTISYGDECILSFNWESLLDGEETGNGALTVKVDGITKILDKDIAQGDVSIDVGGFLKENKTHRVSLYVKDIYSTQRPLHFSITTIALSLKSAFQDSLIQSGSIMFLYTPVGEGTKTMHISIDGTEVWTKTTAANNRQEIANLEAQTHGVHTIKAWFTATVNSQDIVSNTLKFMVICTEEGKTDPIIALRLYEDQLKQYYTYDIGYQVWTPAQLTDVTLNDGDNITELKNVSTAQNIWAIRKDTQGTYTLSITAAGLTVSKTITVGDSGIEIDPIQEGLDLYLTSKGHVAGSAIEWSYNDIACEFTGINAASSGWKYDSENIPVMRLTGDARMTIPFQPFGKEVSVYGKTLEFEFATSDVFNYDTVVIDCLSEGRGLQATAQAITLYSSENSLYTQYKEGEHVRVSFVISASTDKTQGKIVYCYINGIMSGAFQYGTDLFGQIHPVNITIGSNDCTTDIYCVRIYDRALSRYEIVDTWIADTQNGEELLNKVEANDIYENDIVTEAKLLQRGLPCLVIEGTLPESKKAGRKIVSGRYTDPNDASKSFTYKDAGIKVQGTSSQFYPRKNYTIEFDNGFIMSNGTTVDKYAINNGVPVNTFTFKADYASSEGANNVELVKLYDEVSPHKTPMQKTNSKIRQGIDGFPIAIFHGSDFIGKYNFNNDKGTAEVFGFSEGDQSWEITGNGSNFGIFKSADFETYDDIKEAFESRYPEEDKDVVITQLKEMMTWVVSTDTTVKGLEKTEIEARLNKFKTEFDNYFNRESTFFYYLFTEMFLMVDSRAKNAFPSLFLQDGKWCWLPYDMDTALGIDNNGELLFSYNLEDIDSFQGEDVYNGQDSVLWTNLRKCFYSELGDFYRERIRNNDNFTYESIEKRFEDHQAKWPVALWNEDAYFKYIEPLLQNGEKRLKMLQGAKEEQRKWWLYNRFRYIDSKYNSGNARNSYITFRAYSNNNGSNSVLEITPYADIYARVEFDTQVAFARAPRGEKTTLVINGISNPNEMVANIFSADQLADIGDLSGFQPRLVNLAAAINLQSIKVGDSSEGFSNARLTELTLGNNRLLKSIDARNCVALNTPITAEQCISLEEAYFENTKIPSISLPNGGMVKTLHLPDTLVYLQLRNLSKLTDLQIAGYSNLRTVWIENPSEAIMDIVPEMIIGLPEGANVRALGIDTTVDSESELLAFFEKLDTLRGLDAEGNPTIAKAAVSGIIHIDTMTYDDKVKYETMYPDFTIDAKQLMCRVQFYDESGSTLLAGPVYVEKGAAVSYTGQVPSKTATAQYNYTFVGWSREKNSDENNLYEGLNKVETNLDLYAAFRAQLRSYTIKFVNASYSPATVLQSKSTAYGETPVYAGQTPVYNPSASDIDDWGEFLEWTPQIVPVVGDATYTAKFKYVASKTLKLLSGAIKTAESDIATNVGAYTFYYKQSLTTVSFPAATSVGHHAFCACRTLTSIEFPVATRIGDYAFEGCSALTSVSIPLVESIGGSAFHGCGSITSVDFPLVTSIGSHAFWYCSNLTNVDFPLVTSIYRYAFSNCSSLTSANFPRVTSIGEVAFEYCRALTALYIGTESDTVCTLSSTSAIPSNVTKIYVPFLLVDKYKTATNWSSFSSKIAAYEEPVECISLSITADNVPGYATTTTVHITATCKYNLGGVSQGDTTKVFTWDDTSAAFEQNLSEESQRNVTVSFEFLGVNASTTIVQDKYRNLVGGTIFYIDSSADGVYEFYDINGELISDIAVGDKPYTYKVITPGSKDKYYILHDELYSNLRWTYYKDGSYVYTSLGTGTAIGTGKSNTATVLAADDGAYITANSNGYPTIWYKLQQIRNAYTGGKNDWFVPSRFEAAEVRRAGLMTPEFEGSSRKYIMSSSEGYDQYSSSSVYTYTYPSWNIYSKSYDYSVFFVRAF